MFREYWYEVGDDRRSLRNVIREIFILCWLASDPEQQFSSGREATDHRSRPACAMLVCRGLIR